MTWILALTQAFACGGLFCSAAQPVDQTGERILFVLDGPEIEVHVQISYEGPSESFSWIVPTPAEPTLTTSVDDIFSRLGMATAPLFQPTIVDLGDCQSIVSTGGGPPGVAMEADMASGGDGSSVFSPEQPIVTVVSEVQVGPYDAQILTANGVEVLVEWLTENGYDLPENGRDAIAPYVSSGSYYIGLKLQKDKEVGDLVPVAFRYPGTEPVIPLQLTRVAASDDMRLQPFVLGPARAVPDNYLHVVLNDFAVDWINVGANYLDVIRRAADAAGGQAFATDAAIPVSEFEGSLWAADRYPLDAIRSARTADDLRPWLLQLGYLAGPVDQRWQEMDGIPLTNGTIPILARYTALGEEDPFSFFNCMGCSGDPADVAVDGAGLADALLAEWVEPMRHAQELIDRSAWLTRMTSSISPSEMTADPRFTFNADMAALDRARSAELQFDCRLVHNRSKAPRALVLPDGRRLDLPSLEDAASMGFVWDEWIGTLADLPAERVEQTSRAGDPSVMTDNGAQISAALAEMAGCGCEGTHGSFAGVALLLAALRRRQPL